MNTHDEDDTDLRHLFDDAVSDVHPRGGPGEIRVRARRTSSRRWLPLTVAAAAATIAVIAGVSWVADQQRNETATGPSADPSTDPYTGPGPRLDGGSGRDVRLRVYYVGETPLGPRLFPEARTFTGVDGIGLDEAVRAVVSGSPHDPDYSGWGAPEGAVSGVSVEEGRLDVDLSEARDRPAGLSEAQATALVQAVVATAQRVSGSSDPVRFTVDGEPVDSVLGVDTRDPVAAAPEEATAPLVSISSPGEGDMVGGGFRVEGLANTFEANVVWELRHGDEVVREGFATAAQCCTWAPYSFEVEAPPGEYTLMVHDTDESGGEGLGVSEDTKNLTVE